MTDHTQFLCFLNWCLSASTRWGPENISEFGKNFSSTFLSLLHYNELGKHNVYLLKRSLILPILEKNINTNKIFLKRTWYSSVGWTNNREKTTGKMTKSSKWWWLMDVLSTQPCWNIRWICERIAYLHNVSTSRRFFFDNCILLSPNSATYFCSLPCSASTIVIQCQQPRFHFWTPYEWSE